jgi:hypothetical protein
MRQAIDDYERGERHSLSITAHVTALRHILSVYAPCHCATVLAATPLLGLAACGQTTSSRQTLQDRLPAVDRGGQAARQSTSDGGRPEEAQPIRQLDPEPQRW